jgi:hypothetical protein
MSDAFQTFDQCKVYIYIHHKKSIHAQRARCALLYNVCEKNIIREKENVSPLAERLAFCLHSVLIMFN